nr:PTS transporter subunit EIIC [uncultured Tolumonas sp.]
MNNSVELQKNIEIIDPKKSAGAIDFIFHTINSSFKPIISILAASGLMKGILAILIASKILIPEENVSSYQILAAISNSIFYFMPVMLGFSIAKHLKLNSYLGATLGAILLEPNFTALLNQPEQTFFSIPVIPADFGGSVFPIFTALALLFLINNFLTKINKNTDDALVSVVSLAIIAPVIIISFGDLGITFGSKIAHIIQIASNIYPTISGAIIGAFMIFIVFFGLHWGLLPLILANISNDGDNIAPLWACSTFALMGVALACLVINKNYRTISFLSLFSGLFAGITEPITYGILVKFKKTIPIAMLSGSIGGAFNGFHNIRLMDVGFHSVLSLQLFTPISMYLIGISISFFAAFLMCIILKKKVFQ